jgi:hypothetical protein
MYIHQNKINIHLMEIEVQTSYIVQRTTTSFMYEKITIDLDITVMYYHKNSKTLERFNKH